MHHALLNAAIRAIQGESHLNAISLAFGDGMRVGHVTWVVAAAPTAHPIVRAVAALHGNLPALVDASTIADPVLHDVLAQTIGTPEGRSVLREWAKIAPAGWGCAHATALIDAIKNDTVSASIAAALIGPCNTSARLLRSPNDIAFVIRCWGQSMPDAPTAWMNLLSAEERDRMVNSVRRDPYAAARCLPWLPHDRADRTSIGVSVIDAALDAFAEASPTARTLHAAFVQRLVAHANTNYLSALTRLACVMKEDAVWERVQTLIWGSPDAAYDVVTAVPWDALAETVRVAILACADQSDICAAVAAAQGRKDARRIARESAAAFFAALNPTVWDAIPSTEQRQWRDTLEDVNVHLAVHSLGPRPEMLAKAVLSDHLISAVRRYAPNTAALHWTIFPIVLRFLSPDASHALIAALPTPPPDPSAFFVIASGHTRPPIIPAEHVTLWTSADLACAVALQRAVSRHDSIADRCAALHNALRGWTWERLKPLMPLFDADICAVLTTVLTHDWDALVERLAHPNRKETLHQALDRLTSLPLEVVIPTLVALTHATSWETSEAAAAIANALHDHGDVFLEIVDALASAHSAALLPLPEHGVQANALRTLASDDPPTARRLARALRSGNLRAALRALLHTPPRHADAVWQALDHAVRSAMVAHVSATTSYADLIAPGCPLVALALAVMQSEEDDLRTAGVAALAARPDVLRAIWDNLPQETQKSLRAHPDIAVAVADIPARLPSPTAHRGRIC